MYIHFAELRVFAYDEENHEKIRAGLTKFIPFDMKKQRIKIKSKNAIGFNERKIKIFNLRIIKRRHTNAFIKHLRTILDEKTRKIILAQAESRLDQDLHFFLRFDRDALIEENKFKLTNSGNCYHIKMSVAAFPKSREKGLETVRSMFS